jgi:Rod binding domain-containing protein
MDAVRMSAPAMDVARMILPAPNAMKPLEAMRPAADAADSAAVARKFQSLLGAMLVKEMRGTLSSGFFGSGAGGDVYGGWLDEHVGEALAKRDALHLEGTLRESIDRKARQAEVKP